VPLNETGWTKAHYTAFRVVFGAYLVAHFLALIPWGAEVFSNRGVLPDGSASPLLHLFPNVLAVADSPGSVTALLALGALLAACLAAGLCDRIAAVAISYLWACLYGRNPLIANPSLPYVGWLLLAHAAIPAPPPGREWRFPASIQRAAWIVLALGYSYAGYTKLVSPSWLDGTAIARILDCPLARPGRLREWLLGLPSPVLATMTWGTLGLELLFAPLALARRARPWVWGSMLALHITLIVLIDFADLSLGMVLVHLFTLDPTWFRSRSAICHRAAPSAPLASLRNLSTRGACGAAGFASQFVTARRLRRRWLRFAKVVRNFSLQSASHPRERSVSMRASFFVAVTALAVTGLAACTTPSSKPTQSASPEKTPDTAPSTTAATAQAAATAAPETSATPTLAAFDDRVSGPFVHANLAVFVLASDARDDTDYLTLDEGLKDGSVVVSEKASQQVNELEIENRSGRPLFVQTGDRLVGGKQDRIVGSSFVVPPNSGSQPVHSFCVEHGRWSGRSMRFGRAGNLALATQSVRVAALGDDQGAVWKEVAAQKSAANKFLGAPDTNSSLTETLDSPEVKMASDEYVLALEHVLDDKPDAVGVAFALNGKVLEVDTYPGRPLVAKLYPKLLASYALQAALRAKDPTSAVACAQVERFVREGEVLRTRRLADGVGVLEYQEKIESDADCNGKRAVTIIAK
jgi:hypothetical protein